MRKPSGKRPEKRKARTWEAWAAVGKAHLISVETTRRIADLVATGGWNVIRVRIVEVLPCRRRSAR